MMKRRDEGGASFDISSNTRSTENLNGQMEKDEREKGAKSGDFNALCCSGEKRNFLSSFFVFFSPSLRQNVARK